MEIRCSACGKQLEISGVTHLGSSVTLDIDSCGCDVCDEIEEIEDEHMNEIEQIEDDHINHINQLEDEISEFEETIAKIRDFFSENAYGIEGKIINIIEGNV